MTKKSLARLDRDKGQPDHMSDATQYGAMEIRTLAHVGDSVYGEPITQREIDKTRRLMQAYGAGGSVTGRLPPGVPTEAAEQHWDNLERAMKLSKQNFQRLAQMTREIDAAIAASTPLPPGVHEQVMGVIRARLAFVCAEGNPAFDSFRFDAACKGTRE